MDMGLLAGRYKVGTDDNITMIALVRQSPADKSTTTASRVFYSFSLTRRHSERRKCRQRSGGAEDRRHVQPDNGNDPAAGSIIDSGRPGSSAVPHALAVRQPDRGAIRQSLVPEQWLRLIKDGKDIGYTYLVEEIARDLPRRGQQLMDSGGNDGVLIGVRTRTLPEPGTQVDTESWMWSCVRSQNGKVHELCPAEKSGRGGRPLQRDRIDQHANQADQRARERS